MISIPILENNFIAKKKNELRAQAFAASRCFIR